MLLTASFFGLKIQAFLILLIPLTLAYPHCNPALYGTPKENSCHDIFFDRPWTGNKGLESLDKKTHYFGAVGNPRTRPADVERGQWARPVDLPRTWHSGECSALLSPNLNFNGQPKYDTGTYATIAGVSSSIEFVCGHNERSLTTGLMSGGSINSAGDHYRLTLILYDPRSRFADIIKPYIAAGRIIDYGAITLSGPPVPNSNPFKEPKTEGTKDPNQPESSSNGANHQRPASAAPAQCGRRPYCSRASHCSNKGCKCVADGNIDYWSTSCKAPFADAGSAVASTGRGMLEIDGNSSSSNISTSGTSSSSGNTMSQSELIGSYLSNMACPCNCTYVSKQCCTSDSGFVYEEPAKHLGSLRPPMETLECDLTTGDWKEKNGTRNGAFGA